MCNYILFLIIQHSGARTVPAPTAGEGVAAGADDVLQEAAAPRQAGPRPAPARTARRTPPRGQVAALFCMFLYLCSANNIKENHQKSIITDHIGRQRSPPCLGPFVKVPETVFFFASLLEIGSLSSLFLIFLKIL
jgi:hypothetical protein